ncbi:MAG: hypothetical protein HN337_04575 [Deltaproteobacteria bacterium]|nr:hypothetical protein [Deltaproteobacteria bacterium]
MSNTISNYIKGIATLYNGDATKPEEPKLTEMDFLATLALDKRCGDESNLRTLNCHRGYHDEQDKFIDETVGSRGSTKRLCFDLYAKALYRLALRYLDSKDEVSCKHHYLHCSRKIETAAKSCR